MMPGLTEVALKEASWTANQCCMDCTAESSSETAAGNYSSAWNMEHDGTCTERNSCGGMLKTDGKIAHGQSKYAQHVDMDIWHKKTTISDDSHLLD